MKHERPAPVIGVPAEHIAQAEAAAAEMRCLTELNASMAWGLLFSMAMDFPDPEHPVDLRKSDGDEPHIRTRRCLHDELRYVAACEARDWARLAHPIQLEATAAAALNAMPPNLRRYFLNEAVRYFEGVR